MSDKSPWALGLDIGGTKIVGGLVNAQGELARVNGKPLIIKYEYDGLVEGSNRAQELLVRIGQQLLAAPTVPPAQICAVGLGVAGIVDFTRGRVVIDSANVPGMEEIDFPVFCAEQFGLPAYADNDGNCAAYAEAHFGAGRGCDPVFCATLGAGVGGGLIVGGEIYRGFFGSAMEIGHTVVNYQGGPCPCGGTGHLEKWFATEAIERRLAQAVQEYPSCLIAQYSAIPQQPTVEALFAAVRDDDPVAQPIVDDILEMLAAALGTASSLLAPEVVVIGGGMAQAGEVLFAPLRAKLPKYIAYPSGAYLPAIVPAALGPEATLIGAGALALAERSKAKSS